MNPKAITQRVIFAATQWAIDFVDCEDVVARLSPVFRGWSIDVTSPQTSPHLKPRATITRRGDGWVWQEHGFARCRTWDRVPPKTPMRVITDVHETAINWYLDDNPELLCLHGAAVKLGSGLVCFPAKGRAGKSTLMATFAAHGHKLFCDDVLGLSPPHERGVSLGLQPRLRMPLAPRLKPRTTAFIARQAGFTDATWHYLKLGRDHLARLGESAPIKAFVLLERFDMGPPILTEARTSEVLKNVIAENIIRKLPMPVIFERLHRLVATRARFRLRYSDPEAAVRLLAREFA